MPRDYAATVPRAARQSGALGLNKAHGTERFPRQNRVHYRRRLRHGAGHGAQLRAERASISRSPTSTCRRLEEARDEIEALGVNARGLSARRLGPRASLRDRRRGRARFRQGAHRLQQCRGRLRRAGARRDARRDFRLDVRRQHDGADQRLQGVRAEAQEAWRGRAHRQHRLDRRGADRARHEQRHLCRHQVRGGGAVLRDAGRDGAAQYRRVGAVPRRRRHQHLSCRPRAARSASAARSSARFRR